jgi:NAD-dependent dihydropyrimidine dehydrogenase PreA subunit/NAD(P)H-dependent FMN reductase
VLGVVFDAFCSWMRTLLLYFSNTGCTQHVAKRCAAALTAAGGEAILHSITTPSDRAQVTSEVIGAADAFVILAPVHMMGVPAPVVTFLNSLAPQRASLAGKSVAAVATFGGTALMSLQHITAPLNRLGLRVVAKRALIMPDNYPKIMPAASKLNWGTEDVQAVEDFAATLPGLFAAGPAAKVVAKRHHTYAKPLSARWMLPRISGPVVVNNDTCIRCSACVRACPTGCLSMQEVASTPAPATADADRAAVTEQQPTRVVVQNFAECIGCASCWHACKPGALEYEKMKINPGAPRFRFSEKLIDGNLKTVRPLTKEAQQD